MTTIDSNRVRGYGEDGAKVPFVAGTSRGAAMIGRRLPGTRVMRAPMRCQTPEPPRPTEVPPPPQTPPIEPPDPGAPPMDPPMPDVPPIGDPPHAPAQPTAASRAAVSPLRAARRSVHRRTS